MKTALFLAVVACLGGVSYGQVFSWGSCPEVTVQENFDINRYLGRWYENRRFFAIFEAFSDCVTAEYSLNEDGSVKVNNTGDSKLLRRATTAIGDAREEDGPNPNPAKLGVRFSPAQPSGDYWVLSTDYDTYSIVWSCTPVWTIGNYQFAWILTRGRTLPDQKIRELEQFMKKLKIKTNKFSVTNQENCPF